MRHKDMEKVRPTLSSRVVCSVQGSTYKEACDGAQPVRDHDPSLPVSPPAARKNFTRDGMEQWLGTEGDANDTESGNDHINRSSPGNDDASDDAK